MILVVDTCTERMIVGLRSSEGDQWVNMDSRATEGPANHARDLLPSVEQLLAGRKPFVIGVALGPGSFTGVRIGLATAKGLAEGWEIPLVGLDNLAAMASAWTRLAPASSAAVLPVIDARKNKYYAALYQNGRELIAPGDRSAEDWVAAARLWSGDVVVSGYQGNHLAAKLGALPSGWTTLETLDWTPGLLDQAERAWKNGQALPPEAAPRYLRLSEAEENLRARSS